MRIVLFFSIIIDLNSFFVKGQEYLSDSSDFLIQKELPKKALFIGARIISFAFTTIAKTFGCDVTVLQHDELVLKNFDQEFVGELIEINKKRGVSFFFNDELNEYHHTLQLDKAGILVDSNAYTSFYCSFYKVMIRLIKLKKEVSE